MSRQKKILAIGGPGSEFQGVAKIISPQDLPPYVFQNLINFTPNHQLGKLVKRDRYQTLNDEDVNDAVKCVEFQDSNGGRILLLLIDDDSFEEMIYTSSYAAPTAITDARISGKTLDTFFPLNFQNVVRSGAGINAATDYPMWYGYIPQQDRFPVQLLNLAVTTSTIFSQTLSASPVDVTYNGTLLTKETVSPTTPGTNEWGYSGGSVYVNIGIAITKLLTPLILAVDRTTAGRSMEDQFYSDCLSDFLRLGLSKLTGYQHTSDLAGRGAETGWYYFVMCPVLDSRQKSFPSSVYGGVSYDGPTSYPGQYGQVTAANGGIVLQLAQYYTDPTYAKNGKRITDIDIFVAFIGPSKEVDPYKYPFNWLDRVSLESNGDYFLELTGTTAAAGPTVTLDAVTSWKTFNPVSFYIYNETDKEHYRITGVSGNVLTVSPAPTTTAGSKVIKFYSGWYLAGTTKLYPIMYDNYYKKLGSEMYSYLGIPRGDMGRTDVRYKYLCESNKRLFYIGADDGFIYYSVPNGPDVVPSLNIIRPRHDIVAGVGVAQDVVLFGKNYAERVSILSNTATQQDDSFLNVGCVGQRSIAKIDDNFIAWMSYKGPYIMINRESKYIGELIQTWFLGSSRLSNTILETTITAYNKLRDQIWFIVPGYTTTPFTTAIIFVFDMTSYRKGMAAWFYFQTNMTVADQTINIDGHLLAIEDDLLVDFNGTTPDETVSSLLRMLLLKNDVYGERARLSMKKLYLDYTGGDTVVARVYMDGSGTPVNLTLNANKEAYIHYLCQTLDLEVYTSATDDDFEIDKIALEFRPKVF